MTKVALSHIRDCALLAASFAMVLFVVLSPGGFAVQSPDPSGRTASTDRAAELHDGRLADLANPQRSEPELPADIDR